MIEFVLMRIHSNLSIVLISILSFKVNGSAVPQPRAKITIHQFKTILAELIIDSKKNLHDFRNAYLYGSLGPLGSLSGGPLGTWTEKCATALGYLDLLPGAMEDADVRPLITDAAQRIRNLESNLVRIDPGRAHQFQRLWDDVIRIYKQSRLYQ